MNKVQRKLEYSLMALKLMSGKRPGELTSAKEVADTFSAPFDVMARVLQLMAQKQILRAEHGAQGGYQITKDLSKVSLHELVTLIQGPVQIAKCMHKEETCDIQASCNIVNPIHSLNQKLSEFYKGLSLQDLLFQRPSAKTELKATVDKSEVNHG